MFHVKHNFLKVIKIHNILNGVDLFFKRKDKMNRAIL